MEIRTLITAIDLSVNSKVVNQTDSLSSLVQKLDSNPFFGRGPYVIAKYYEDQYRDRGLDLVEFIRFVLEDFIYRTSDPNEKIIRIGNREENVEYSNPKGRRAPEVKSLDSLPFDFSEHPIYLIRLKNSEGGITPANLKCIVRNCTELLISGEGDMSEIHRLVKRHSRSFLKFIFKRQQPVQMSYLSLSLGNGRRFSFIYIRNMR